jgi:hypothetical protein
MRPEDAMTGARGLSVWVAMAAGNTAGAGAQPILVPSAFTAPAGGGVTIAVQEERAQGLVALPWRDGAAWVFVRQLGGQRNYSQEDPPPVDPARPADLRVTVEAPGVALVGLDMTPREWEWSAGEIAAFAAGAAHQGDCPAGPARVTRLLSAATLIRGVEPGHPPAPDQTAVSKAGLQVEFRPLIDPTAMASAGDVPVRLYVLGEGVPRAAISAVHQESGHAERFSTDTKGITNVRIDRAGVWRLEFDALLRASGPDSPWVAASATLTFEVPAFAEPAPAGEAPR